MQLRYELFTMNLKVTEVVGQVMNVFFFNRFFERIALLVLPNGYWNRIPSQWTSIFQRLFCPFDSTKPGE